MKYRFIVVGIALCFSSMPVHSQVNLKKTAMAWLETLNKHDTVSLGSFYAADVEVESSNWDGIKKGRSEAVTVYTRYFMGTPSLAHVLKHIYISGDHVILEYVSSGIFEHPEPGTPDYMKGKKYELKNCTILSFKNGKIIRQVNYFDQVAFLRQVGFFENR